MFALFRRRPEVEFLELQDHKLIFRSPEPLAEGRDETVRLRGAELPQTDVRVAIHRVRPLEEGGFACVATVRGDSACTLKSARRADSAADLAALRKHARTECSFPVLSVDLPGYKATAIDISQGGMQLLANGRAQVGEVLTLSLQPFDNQAVECRVRVAWVAGQLDTGFRVGVQFQD